MNRIFTLLGLFALSICVVGAQAPRSVSVRNAFLITSPDVAQALGLSSAQIQKRNAVTSRFSKVQEKIDAKIQGGLADGEGERIRLEMDTAQGAAEREMVSLLSATQQKRFRQIAIQSEGVEIFRDDQILSEVGFSAAQKAKVSAQMAALDRAREQYYTGLADAFSKIAEPTTSDEATMREYARKQQAARLAMKPQFDRVVALEKSTRQGVVSLMNPVQRKKWEAIVGQPFKRG